MVGVAWPLPLVSPLVLVTIVVLLLGSAHGEVSGRNADEEPELICYYGSWARLRDGEGRVTIDQLDPRLCTTLVFAFAQLDDQRWTLLHSLPDTLLFYRQLTGLKRRWPRLRVELAVGGWNDSRHADYAAMAAEPERRATFAASAANAMETFGFDGFHLDWEFPDGARQRSDFTRLLEALREKLSPRGWRLSAAVSAGAWRSRNAYEMDSVARLTDRLLIMAYDLHGGWIPESANHHAPLHERSSDFSGLDAESSVEMWVSAGADPRKIVLGVPLYGRGWLVDAPGEQPPFKARGVAPAGPVTAEAGILSYLEICSNVLHRGWTSQQLLDGGVPYGTAAVGEGQWFGYDDEHAVAEKARLTVELGLAGAFVWDIAQDDVRGLCSPRPFTLTTILKETLTSATEERRALADGGEASPPSSNHIGAAS